MAYLRTVHNRSYHRDLAGAAIRGRRGFRFRGSERARLPEDILRAGIWPWLTEAGHAMQPVWRHKCAFARVTGMHPAISGLLYDTVAQRMFGRTLAQRGTLHLELRLKHSVVPEMIGAIQEAWSIRHRCIDQPVTAELEGRACCQHEEVIQSFTTSCANDKCRWSFSILHIGHKGGKRRPAKGSGRSANGTGTLL